MRCARCGASFPGGAGSTVRLIGETDVVLLGALLRGDLDSVRCPACQAALGRTPMLIAVLPSKGAAYYTAGQVRGHSPTASVMRANLRALLPGAAAPRLVEHPDAEALRRAVTTELAGQLVPLRAVVRAVADGTMPELISVQWRMLTPAVFAAGHLAVVGEFPQLELGGADADESDDSALAPLVAPHRYAHADRLAALTLVQLAALDELCREWSAFIDAKCASPPGVTFEEDLHAYVDRGPDRSRLATAAHEVLREQEGLVPYVLEAVLASLHAGTGVTNPRGSQWAELYFAHELVARARRPPAPYITASRVAAERAQATIPHEHAWGAAGAALATLMTEGRGGLALPGGPALLEEIATGAGHPHLMEAMSQAHLRSAVNTVEGVVQELRREAATRGPDDLVPLVRLHAEFLVAQGRVEDLEAVAEALRECLGGDGPARGRSETWLAGALNRAHRPASVITRLGTAPQPWEAELDTDLRVNLHHERATALEGAGRLAEALAIRVAVLGLLNEASPRHPWALTNLALTQLDMGRPDLALPGIEKAIRLLGPDPSLLEYKAMAHEAVGDRSAAEAALAMAERLSSTDRSRHYALLRAHRLAVRGRSDEAIGLLTSASGLKGTAAATADGRDLLTESRAWAALLDRRAELHPAAEARAAALPPLLHTFAEWSEAAGHATLAAAAHRCRAELLDAMNTGATGDDLVAEAWREAHAVGERHGLAPDGMTLLKLAFDAYAHADTEAARRHLAAVPAAVAAEIGGVPDISKVVHAPAKLAAPLADIGGLLLGVLTDGGTEPSQRSPGAARVEWPDFRMVAELQRDAAGRAASRRRLPDVTVLDEGFTDAAVARLAQPGHGLVVVEWFYVRHQDDQRDSGLCSVLTRIDAAGHVTTYFLPQEQIDYARLGARLRKRLFDWRPRRRGDPLDQAEWRRAEEWMVNVLRTCAEADDHVVVLAHAAMAGLPWHTAIGPHWSVSYASGWTALHSLLRQPVPPRERIGVLTVPRSGEQPEVAAALRASAGRAAALGAGAVAPQEGACDIAAFEEVMRHCDVAVLLCHGFVNHVEHEVALMLADRGNAPLADSVAAGSSLGNAHRLSWRDCVLLPHASRTVFSAACSSGMSHHAGLGDRLGIFGALRHSGTSAVVAPGWDVVASATLPVLDATLARFMAGQSLGRALRQASLDATEDLPAWLAWSLTLEGDWR
ncbi:CHAT domain-containing protein [Streptomyces sp. SID12501]|uniref:CHAT domain-containing protein n=1 Tax=Streptomyces sp. SID12501 TaxID=2706042 RepID=A0A6B3BYJ1_9ACTN|nr:CHAT domain-containing protein [Streptomyces sp. SID12501]NEC89507.1 CHAT domain-containing protein [Streptomyces sp. SID12501]